MKKVIQNREVRVLLHNIRSTHNVGSMFRTSDACGISKIYISGYTPSPLDQFGRKRKDIAKTALGAEDAVAWEQIPNLKKCIAELKKEGYKIVAIEQSKNSIDYKKVKFGKRSVVLVGNEVSGMSPAILSLCDIVAEIPMRGKKESLNVSVAFGVALFSFLA